MAKKNERTLWAGCTCRYARRADGVIERVFRADDCPVHSSPEALYGKPTNEERAAWYSENRTSVAEQVNRMSFYRWASTWAGAIGWIVCEGIAAVWRRVRS